MEFGSSGSKKDKDEDIPPKKTGQNRTWPEIVEVMDHLDRYSFEQLNDALGDVESAYLLGDSKLRDIDLERDYLGMLKYLGHSLEFKREEYPDSYDELVESGNRDALMDLLEYLDIDVGRGGDQYITHLFYEFLINNTKKSILKKFFGI